MEINIFLPEAVNDPSALSRFGNKLGLNFTSAKWYLDWSDNFTPEIARGFNQEGVIPELTWQPQIGDKGVLNNEVISGKYDHYILDFAKDVRSLGFPVRINLAPEANGDWEPWFIGQNGNNPKNFKTFWKYVISKFRSQGANNVSWIWAPNIHYGETYSFLEFYPGNDYVDFLGLDGYNWGTTQPWSQWQSFSQIFENSYNDLVNLSDKDIIITEFASAEKGGSKSEWILDMFHDVRSKFPRIQGITWFNINKETDWRINSSGSSLEAFIQGAHGKSSNTRLESINQTNLSNRDYSNNIIDNQNSSNFFESKKAKILSDQGQKLIPTFSQNDVMKNSKIPKKGLSQNTKNIAGTSTQISNLDLNYAHNNIYFVTIALNIALLLIVSMVLLIFEPKKSEQPI